MEATAVRSPRERLAHLVRRCLVVESYLRCRRKEGHAGLPLDHSRKLFSQYHHASDSAEVHVLGQPAGSQESRDNLISNKSQLLSVNGTCRRRCEKAYWDPTPEFC